MKDILDALNWRAAIKQYDTDKKLSDDQYNSLMDALCLSPSSFGLEPWRAIVVTNPEIRAQLKEAAWGQAQVSDSSHLVVFCVPTAFGDVDVEKFVDFIAEVRGVERSTLADYEGMMKGSLANKSEEEKIAWCSKQAYLALGFLLSAAALEGVDASPMEGFSSEKFDEILGLKGKGLTSVVIAGLGFRSEDDAYSKMKKIRFPKDQMIIEVK